MKKIILTLSLSLSLVSGGLLLPVEQGHARGERGERAERREDRELPDDLLVVWMGADLHHERRSVGVDTDHPVTIVGKISKKHIRGDVRGGGPLLKIDTGSGRISIN